MNKALDFQSIIMALQQFWAERDCLIWQPYYTQVGAGTMNPATFLRVLGPEPWKVAYVEPSIRPDDGRYGDNPYRLQQFYQFQVILKPDPGNPQEIYLDSLRALGIDPDRHDIRFVEDNWQQPAIGAWGLGWEVWLDGQEITQFTYFQQCGGQDLDPVSVEITYGLERIAMVLQGVHHFTEIQWSPERTYGDVNLMGEREHSAYYFDTADVDRTRHLYDLYEQEAEAAISAGLVLPAHDYVLKTSHTFNILDTRGAVGVTERQALFKRTRELARRVAEAYVAQRAAEQYPWLKSLPEPKETASQTLPQIQSEEATFILEIGTEELPPSDLMSALDQLESAVPDMLQQLRLDHGAIRIMGTPRRLVILVDNLATYQPDQSLEVKGPPAERAFDADGRPTRAAEGFARSRGLDVSQLVVQQFDGGDYVVARVEEQGLPAVEVLREALPALMATIRFNKSMRWNESGVAFSRPIRWLLSLLDAEVVPFHYAGLQSNRTTRGLRFGPQDQFEVRSAADYLNRIGDQGILLDPDVRRQNILDQVNALAAEVGGQVPLDRELLAEVTHLVEQLTAFRGVFDEAYLDALPSEVLVSVMKKHQRYFVVTDSEGKLMPYFIGVRNGDQRHLDVVAEGNEQVILARFADAKFFVEKDLQKPLADFVADLSKLTFQVDLGSLLAKTKRIVNLVKRLGTRLALTDAALQSAVRAAELAKADLATHMVVEMTSLQGIMGRYYALESGEDPVVAQAIFEHYLPRSADDRLPESEVGLVVGIADRLDSLMGLFAVGLEPTGTKDPYAQRRAAIGLCQNLMKWELHFDIRWGLTQAAEILEIEVPADTQNACEEFIAGRLRNLLLDSGYRHDVVDAVLAEQGHDPYGAFLNVQALTAWVSREDWMSILPAYSRCVRITRDLSEIYAINPDLFTEDAEQALYAKLLQGEDEVVRSNSMVALLTVIESLVPFINRYFDSVLVMAEEERVRQNRLGLLQRIAALSDGIADLSNLEGF